MATNKRLGDFESMLRNPVVSVLIIGGGINGAGVFRDLALQGVDVLLVDKGNFCSGAMARAQLRRHLSLLMPINLCNIIQISVGARLLFLFCGSRLPIWMILS
tara:strand:- start:146 stop:454 length:309 start_codon:yes stop_codon:yes gene_type:complete